MASDRHTPTEIEIVHRKKFDVYGENIYLHDWKIWKSEYIQIIPTTIIRLYNVYYTCLVYNLWIRKYTFDTHRAVWRCPLVALTKHVTGLVVLEVVPFLARVIGVDDPGSLVQVVVVRGVHRGVRDDGRSAVTLVDARAICLPNFQGKVQGRGLRYRHLFCIVSYPQLFYARIFTTRSWWL